MLIRIGDVSIDNITHLLAHTSRLNRIKGCLPVDVFAESSLITRIGCVIVNSGEVSLMSFSLGSSYALRHCHVFFDDLKRIPSFLELLKKSLIDYK